MNGQPLLTRDVRAQRRFAYCLCGAVALHAAAVYSPRHHQPRPVAVTPPLLTVPVSLESSPAPPQPTAPSVVAPRPPPVAAATPASLPVAAAPHGAVTSRVAKSSTARAPDRASSRHRDVAPIDVAPSPRPKPAEDASAFGGKQGAFRASVCFVPKGLESALLVSDYPSVATFSTNEIDVSPRRFQRGFPGVAERIEWFGIDYRGRFKVRDTGDYTFRLVSDDGAVLLIDGALVVDNDGVHGARSVKMSMPLSQGDHEFRLLYYQGPGSRLALQLFVKSYQTPERLFGPEI